MVGTSPNGRLDIRVNLKGKVWSREIDIWEMSVYRKTVHNLRLDDTTWGWSGALGCSSIYEFRRGDKSHYGAREGVAKEEGGKPREGGVLEARA